MKKNLTELVFILDRSGSMAGLAEDTIGGFNAMIEKQKKEAGEAFVSTVLFNSRSQVLHDRKKLENVTYITDRDYQPGGGTALLDALGDAIHHIGNIHKYARPEDVPEHTLFLITTDGLENSSRKYTAKQIKSLIEHQKAKYDWEFIFVAANIDASETARTYGINEEDAVEYVHDSEGVQNCYEAMAMRVSASRCSAPSSNWRQALDEDNKRRGKMR